jgi:hypothetical protein
MKAMRRGSRWTQMLNGAGRWGALALTAFYLNFVSVHLATETHFHQGEEHSHSHQDQGHDQDQDQEREHDHEHDDGGHTPHDASEHLLDVALKGAEPVFVGPALAIVSEIFSFDAPVLFTWTQPVFERERPPGESPPDPQQPRAPPLA